MSFIDNTYFIRDISLTSGQLGNITSWITIYEEEILKKLLGYTLYTELQADLDAGVPQTQKFIDLVNGKAFSFDTVTGYTISTKWEGLKNSKLVSLIAYYTYFQYRNENENFNTTSGQKMNNAENSVYADVYPKLVNSWNKMVDIYGNVYDNMNKTMFLENSNYVHFNEYPSAYNYLLANIDDFSNWVFEPLPKLNLWGI